MSAEISRDSISLFQYSSGHRVYINFYLCILLAELFGNPWQIREKYIPNNLFTLELLYYGISTTG